MNYWSKSLGNKLEITFFILIIPALAKLWAWVTNIDNTQFLSICIFSYAAVLYMGFYPLKRMPKWVKRFAKLPDPKE